MKPIGNVLVTGAAGYIGSVLTGQLLERGYRVWGLDSLIFGEESLRGFRQHPNYRFVKGDVRDSRTYRSILDEGEAIIHLAAVVGAPACAKFPDLARETNWVAARELFDRAAEREGVRRFVFASTTSVYGAARGNGFLDEASAVNPVSLYAELKARCEEYVLTARTRSGFVPTVLRFTTAYGASPRMRFDLTVNEFTRECALGRELRIFGRRFWRPYCHVRDLARACIAVLEADRRGLHREVFCVGDTRENYTKEMIYSILVDEIPGARVSFEGEVDDPRDYRVDCSKIATLGFRATRTVREGVREVYGLLRAGAIPDPDAAIYTSDVFDYGAA